MRAQFVIPVLASILILGSLGLTQQALAELIYESATLGPTGASGGNALSINQHLGSRFTVTQTVEVTSIGGHLGNFNGEDLFGVIVKLPGPSVLPAGSPFTVSEVVASTVFTPPGLVSSDVSVPLSVTLPPGDYALIFGSGLFGSTSTRGGIMISNGVDTPAGIGSYIRWTGSTSTWSDNFGSNLRFTINGNILEDTTPPIITVPADITLEAPADTTPANTGTATATDDVDPTPIVTFSDVSVSGTGQTIETITRTWTATDDSGNSVSADQIITVQDTADPVLTVPADITVQTTNLYSVPVTYTITVTDTFDANPTLVCTPASGDLFAVDTTTLVTCDATDASGNTSTDFFNVTVEKIAGTPSDPGPPPDPSPPEETPGKGTPPQDPGPP